MSSNITPPSDVPVSWSRAKRTHTAHCGASTQRDQCACIASCISWSDQVVFAPASPIGIVESPPVLVTSIPTRAYALSRLKVVLGSDAGWLGWLVGLYVVTEVASSTVSYSKATLRNAACSNA